MSEFTRIVSDLFTGIGKFFVLKFWPSVVVPALGFLFGMENTLILQSLLVLVVFDFITGIIAARQSGEQIKSKSAVRSAFKVAVYGLLVSAAHLTEAITPIATFIEEAVITFLALTEMISIIENVGKMGYAIPKRLLKKLQNLRDEDSTVVEKKVTKEKTDPITNITEKHTVEEKKTETHISEKPHI